MSEAEKPKKRGSKDRDGVYKRRGYWHFDYKDPVTGRWRSKTTGETAYNRAKEVKRQFLEALSGQYDPNNDRLRFSEAAGAFLQHRVVSVSPGTQRLEKERLRALARVLGQIAPPDLKLKDFDVKLIRNYQQKRISEGVGPRTVNMETQLLRSILKYHEQWKLDGKYEALPEPVSEVGRALSPEEEVRLLDMARSRPEWFVAYHATVLENETGMRGVEVRNLEIKRIDIQAQEIRLAKSKTKTGVRTIPLNADAFASVQALLQRAFAFGANRAEHYLIPARVRMVKEGRTVQAYDPAKPTKGWRTAWRNLTTAAGLKGLRGHDLRHNWITSHAEIGTPQSVLESQAGHLSKQMSDHYKHISDGAARKAAEEHARVKTEQRTAVRAKLNAAAKNPLLADVSMLDPGPTGPQTIQ